LLSAGQKHRNCLEGEPIEEYFPNAQASVAVCQMAELFGERRMNMFGSRPYTDKARRKRTQRWKPLKEPE
jgi:hypothetical protein